MGMKTIFATLYFLYKVTTAQNPVINVPQTPNIVTRLNTPAPVSPSPTNPYCSPQKVQALIGSPPQVTYPMSTTPKCYTTNDIAIGLGGVLECDNYACCLCKSIRCGNNAVNDPCEIFVVNDHGAIGVESIIIDGGISTLTLPIPGAVIECSGIEACKAVSMITRNVQSLSCDSLLSCHQAYIIISDPAPNFSIHCHGPSSCVGANIMINIGEAPPPGMVCNPERPSNEISLGPIEFYGDKSAQSAIITINNIGCNKVIIPSITCIYDTSCPDTQFIFNGDVILQEFNSGISSLTCSTALECGNLVRTITNPENGFVLECLLTDSCQGLHLILDYQPSTAVYIDHINEFRFNQANAANDAIIIIQNNQLSAEQMGPMRINKIICAEAYSCNGLTIVAGPNVDLSNTFIDCTTVPGSCYGCMIKPASMDFAVPCNYNSGASGSGFQPPPLPQEPPPMPQFIPQPAPQAPAQVPPQPAVPNQPAIPLPQNPPPQPIVPNTQPGASTSPPPSSVPAVPNQPVDPQNPAQPMSTQVPIEPIIPEPAVPWPVTQPSAPLPPPRPVVPNAPPVPNQPADPQNPSQPLPPQVPIEPIIAQPAVPWPVIQPAASLPAPHNSSPPMPLVPSQVTDPPQPIAPNAQPEASISPIPAVPNQPSDPQNPSRPVPPAQPQVPPQPVVPYTGASIRPPLPVVPIQPADPQIPGQPQPPVMHQHDPQQHFY